ncbi:hypothetical protein MHYP_G00286650 [Metynnis hypsauchen]
MRCDNSSYGRKPTTALPSPVSALMIQFAVTASSSIWGVTAARKCMRTVQRMRWCVQRVQSDCRPLSLRIN